MSLALWLAVGACGGAGALARFAVDGAVARRAGGGFPWGTFAVNISGSLVLGVLAGAALHGEASLLAGAATIGAYTTFSTWMLETFRLGEDGLPVLALANIWVSLAVGLAAAELGRLIGGVL